jgi:hypothetical protein
MAGGIMSDGPIPGITIPVDADTSLFDAKVDASKQGMKSAADLAREDADKMLAKAGAMKAEVVAAAGEAKAVVDKTIAEGRSSLQQLKDAVMAASTQMKMMMIHMGTQVWNTVDRMLGISKTAAGKAIGFAISAMTSVISQGNASALTLMATPGGQALGLAMMLINATNMSTQLIMQTQQLTMENNDDYVGEIILGKSL